MTVFSLFLQSYVRYINVIYLVIVIVATTTTVYFSQSTYRVNESSGTIQLALALTNPLSTDVTIQVVDDAAIISEPPFATNIKEDQEEKDYFIETLSITFAAGTTSAILNVAINNDDMDESDETFTFTIDPFSLLMDGITVGYPYQTAVTIVDDDSKRTILFIMNMCPLQYAL